MAQKANIYVEEDYLANVDTALLVQLDDAVAVLKAKMRASIPIKRGGHRVGYGVCKAQRGIAADQIISIARAIKSLKGW